MELNNYLSCLKIDFDVQGIYMTVLKYTFGCCYLRGGQRPPEGPEGPPSPPQELEGGEQSAPELLVLHIGNLLIMLGQVTL